jgi:hemoglobin-like flavoprotein
MGQDEIRQARDSLSRCVASPAFLDRFYELFMASSPEVAEKFASTDFARQKQVLEDSLYLMLSAAGTTGGVAHAQLEKLAKRHSRGELDVRPELYSLWLDSLMKAVRESDPSYSPELEKAWREALKDGIEFLKARY